MHNVVDKPLTPFTVHVPVMALVGLRKSFGPVQAPESRR
jgi:hypothetical protein